MGIPFWTSRGRLGSSQPVVIALPPRQSKAKRSSVACSDTRIGPHVPEKPFKRFKAARRSSQRRNDEFGIALAHFSPCCP